VLVFVFHFFIDFWNCSDSVGFCFPFFYWLLELFRHCWFLFSILLLQSCGQSFKTLEFHVEPTILMTIIDFLKRV
jgi:hypothetical protein